MDQYLIVIERISATCSRLKLAAIRAGAVLNVETLNNGMKTRCEETRLLVRGMNDAFAFETRK